MSDFANRPGRRPPESTAARQRPIQSHGPVRIRALGLSMGIKSAAPVTARGAAGGQMSRLAAWLSSLAALLLVLSLPGSGAAQQPDRRPVWGVGDAVVTGFSGTVAPDPGRPRPPGKSAADLTFINAEGPSARIVGLGRPGFAWDGRLWPAPKTFDVLARDVGQVFGIALDDAADPNIYLAATSAFGLHIVLPGRGRDAPAERLKKGRPGAGWMRGLFGLDMQGGPGSIWRVDGRTGEARLFANVTLEGVPNPGPALGALAFDPAHRRVLASDRFTGMIHAFDMEGRDAGRFDHGVTGRGAAGLPPIPFDPRNRPDIASERFDTENPATWGLAPPGRHVWGLAVHDGRLFYSVSNGPEPTQIWSVGLRQDGGFAGDARWELDVAPGGAPDPVTDIAFAQNGEMFLAERAPSAGAYDYAAFTRPGDARVLSYGLETPDDPRTPSRWIAVPNEYAIGFAGSYRNANGGVALGYGYGRDGALSTGACESALWATGQNLRNNPALRDRLEPGGPLVVHGLFVVPPPEVRPRNEPPTASRSVDYDDRFNDPRAAGHLGVVRIRTAPCPPPTAVAGGIRYGGRGYGGPGYAGVPPYGGDTTTVGDCPAGRNPDGTCGIVPIDLAIAKTASQGKYDPATGTWTFQFTLSVTNAGAPFFPQSSIAIADPVPNGVTFTAAAGTNWDCSGTAFPATAPNALACAYGFGPGLFATGASLDPLVVTVTVAAAGTYRNCATVGVSQMPWLQETTLDNNRACAEITVPADLALDKKVGEVKVDPATGVATVQFTLAVTNVGAAVPGSAIQVTDPVPAGMTFTGASGAGWACNAPPALSSGTLTCAYTAGGTVAHNQTLGAITVTATLAHAGTYENCALVGLAAASGLQETALANNRDCEKVVVPVDLALEKTAGAVKYDAATGTWSVEFKLDVSNAGSPFAPGAFTSISDPIPTGLTLVSATGTNWSCTPVPPISAGNLNCGYSFGSGLFNSGAHLNQLILTFTSKTPGKYENCATVGVAAASGSTETTLANNKDCVTVEFKIETFDVSLTKSFEKGATAGTGTFTLKVKNEGGDIVTPGTTIKISDPVPAGVTLTGFGGTSAASWSCTPGFAVVGQTTLTCTYIGTGTFSTGALLPDLALNATLAAAGAETGIYQNCATVGLTNGNTPVPETNTANNTACAVTTTINTEGNCATAGNCPTPEAVCKQDVLFIVDASVSIGGGLGSVKAAISQFLQAMQNKGGSANIFSFNNGGIGTSNPSWTSIAGWTLVTSGNASTLPAPLTLGGTRTDWDDALKHGVAVALTAPLGPKPLVVFITDGEPTAYMDDTSGLEVDANTMPVTASQQAVPWINAIRGNGSPLIAIGFGSVASSGYLDAAFTGNSSGPSNVSLETSSVIKMNSVGSLPGVMRTLGNQMCGALSLNKSISPSYFIHQLPAGTGTSYTTNDTFSFTLALTNNATTPVTGVTVTDQVPTPPIQPSSIVIGTASAGSAAATAGNLVTWSGITLGGRQTATLTFTGKLVKTYTAPANETFINYAQVTAADNYSATVLADMNPISGLVDEPDESYATFGEIIQGPPPPNPCLEANAPTYCFLGVNKYRTNPGAEDTSCTSSPPSGSSNPCPFTISVNLANIPPGSTVSISDQLTLNGTPVSWPATVTPATFCTPLPTVVSFTCNHVGLTGFSGSVNVMIPPGQSGELKNCITVTVTNTAPPFNKTVTSCATVQLAQPSGLLSCPSGTAPELRGSSGECLPPPPVCEPPMVAGPVPGVCVCPSGTVQQGRECVRRPVCEPPMIPGPAPGVCVCPPGTVQQGHECVRRPVCEPPMVPGPAPGVCVCPPGTVQQGRECVRRPVCEPPMVPGPVPGSCVCPPGTVQQGRECVRRPVCEPPMIPGGTLGVCVCPPGTVQQGRECVRSRCEPPRVMRDGRCVEPPPVCEPPRVMRRGECVDPRPICEPPKVMRRGECVDPRPVCEPPKVIRGRCVDPRPVCEPPRVMMRGRCVDPRPVCEPPRVMMRGRCIDPRPVCEPPRVMRGGRCVDVRDGRGGPGNIGPGGPRGTGGPRETGPFDPRGGRGSPEAPFGR
ncbi:MAG TPA: hypothetical protein VF601_20850 [Beijerinckiaceae bacterium]